MRQTSRVLFWPGVLILVLALLVAWGGAKPALAQPALAGPPVALQGSGCDRVLVGGVCTLAAGETLDHSIVVIGGTLIVEEGGRVDGDVTLTGGTVRVGGHIEGDIIATGGLVNLEDSAVVSGNITLADARLDREAGAQVEGRVRSNASGPFRFTSSEGLSFPHLNVSLDPLWQMLTFLFRAFLWAGLAILLVLFLPRQTQTVAQGALRQPVLVGGVGLLTVVLAGMLFVLLAITLVGIPLVAVGAAVLGVAWAFGLVALGVEVGARLAVAFKQDWALPVSAGIGTFVLVTITGALGFVLCGEWLPTILVGILGLGAVVLTRFGSQPYPPFSPAVPLPPSSAAVAVRPELPQIPRLDE